MQAAANSAGKYDPSCTGKISHPTPKEANAQMKLLLDDGDGNLNVYYCRNCGGYHVGHRYGKYRK